MVHNGIIWNDNEVAKEQFKDGIHYVSKQKNGKFNDSEVLMYDLASVIEGKKTDLSCEGSIAFIMVQLDKNGQRKALYFGRNSGNPLILTQFSHGFSLTSEGEGQSIPSNQLNKYDYKTKKFTSTPLTIPYHSYKPSRSTVLYGDWRDWTDDDGYGTTFQYKDTNKYLQPTVDTVIFTEDILNKHKDLARYGYDGEELIIQAVKEVKGALLYDTGYKTADAIEFGDLLLQEMEVEFAVLEDILRCDNDLTGTELDQYIELDIKRELVKKAIDDLTSQQQQLLLTGNRGAYDK